MQRPDWAPDDIDVERPSVARMYDYYLGGSHNFAADRVAARAMVEAVPDAPLMAQANRAFLRRVVQYLGDSGIRQFLDIGSGIPTVGNVHEIAQRAAPDARVVYIDVDPVAVAHSQEILAGNRNAAVVREDLRRPAAILRHPEVTRLIDFSQPVAVMVVAVLHFIPHADHPEETLRTLRAALAPGSHLVLSQAGEDGRRRAEQVEAERVYRRTDNPLCIRSRAELTAFFDGFTLVDPGVVWVPQWRPETPESAEDAERAGFLGGVGRLDG
ncbi:O-Methyltransferase involved in polyketide biosynthesis [Micromonospora matsumotoense]|uniref:O-Methyltransferase involved in polyketide biosynthesis n=1 Tax=Micromonospora matsumotoense TaxID=121616 RepID=A0A1C4UCM9_9ACTN|nr:SAM-dependent methyltransferase [Micromonospora matsumotoense]SCE69465.1 O-Methyltransferase involved in polyketide biosynthesis [Micromonospora matsumotoense]